MPAPPEWWPYVAPSVTFAFGVVGVASFILAIRFNHKALTVGFNSRLALTPTSTLAPRITILVDGIESREIYETTVVIGNTGFKVIESDDFIRPLCIELSAPIIAVEVGEKMPVELAPDLRIDVDKLEVSPLLLNAGDWLSVRAYTSSKSIAPKVRYRIKGINRHTHPPGLAVLLWPLASLLAFIVGIILYGTQNPSHQLSAQQELLERVKFAPELSAIAQQAIGQENTFAFGPFLTGLVCTVIVLFCWWVWERLVTRHRSPWQDKIETILDRFPL